MKKLYIIKLGGSVITEKEGNRFEAKEHLLARIASEIKQAMEEKKFSLIVVHGAGPFGHTNVVEYGLNEGVFTERQKEGYENTVGDCNFLDSKVVAALQKAGIEAEAFDPNKIVVQDNKKIAEFETKQIGSALALGKVPVLFGQMVPDKSLNASVISGDTIIAFLAKKLKPKKIFLGTDVAGIFTADPKKNPKAKRIPKISKKNFNSVLQKAGRASTVDVTGGMKGKLEKLREMLRGTTAFIFDASEEGNVCKALAGKKIDGTEVRF